MSHFHKIYKVLLFPLALWANLSHIAPSPRKALENGVARHFVLLLVHRHARKI
jgi:hypothetical protein